MSTTSLKLPEELKSRIAQVAEKSDRSPHALMLEILEQGVTAQEKRREFVESALEAQREFDRTREGYAAEDVAAYFEAKMRGEKPPKLKLKKWPR
ncbi:MAG: CopG family transcriptional regulator [Betaproteobacteria bacterium]|nr:CopG family transcriptional regulator [Betaproteobacteria bacterium]